MRKFLYLPIEVSARELDSRLLITHLAIQRGFEVVIGQKWLIQDNVAYMPVGIFLVKTLTSSDAVAMSAARRAGHFVVAIDEEIPGLVAAEQGLRWVSRDAVVAADLIATAGQDHQDAMKLKFAAHANKMVISGNPRWDLLRPEFRYWYDFDVARIKERYGRFLLINTNFGLLNAAKGPPEKVIKNLLQSGKLSLDRPEDVAYLVEGRKVQEANMAALGELFRELPQRFPGHRLVLRPHPSENLQFWKSKLQGAANIDIVREGSAAPWILASDMLIHTSCTTGVEAFALGKPAICLQSIPSPRERLFLANKINLRANSVADVLAIAERLLRSGLGNFSYPDGFDTVFDDFIAARQGRFAADRLLDAIEGQFRTSILSSNDNDRWRPLPGYRKQVRRTATRLQVMPEMMLDDLVSQMNNLAVATGLRTTHFVEKCGDRTYCVRADGVREEFDLAPTWKALAHRWLARSRGLDAA